MNFIKKILTFIKGIFLEDGKPSSKRVFGGISYLACTIAIVGWEHSILTELLYVSAGLIGFSTVFNGIAKIKGK